MDKGFVSFIVGAVRKIGCNAVTTSSFGIHAQTIGTAIYDEANIESTQSILKMLMMYIQLQ
jgi:hypothetical protein